MNMQKVFRIKNVVSMDWYMQYNPRYNGDPEYPFTPDVNDATYFFSYEDAEKVVEILIEKSEHPLFLEIKTIYNGTKY